VFEANIEIDDHSSPERWERPYAHIYFSKHSQMRVETIDIIESVKENPASIGHPAIVVAIHHWQRVVHARRVIERDDITTRDEWGKAVKEVMGEREIRVAENNLKAIGKALVDGANEAALPNAPAFAFNMKSARLWIDDKETVLYKAWERLAASFIDSTDGVKQVLAKLETVLLAFESQPYTDSRNRRVSANRVMEFLRTGGEYGGERFVGYDQNGKLKRRRWIEFRNAFAGWYYGLGQTVVQQYLETAAKQDLIDEEVYQPSWVSPQGNVCRILHYLLSTQLVAVREPMMLSEEDIDVDGIERAIKKSASNTEEIDEGK
jgi:hypothetical protein